MKFMPWQLDPLEWEFVLSLYGLPLKYNLEHGVKYRLKGLLGPASSVRIIDEHGTPRFAAESQIEHSWNLNLPFICEKDMGDYIMVQYLGEAENLRFEWDGINFAEFGK